MGNSTASAAAEAAMADIFADMLMAGGLTFASFERGALAEGHAIMARAMGRALERLDAALCAEPPSGLRVHDVRERSLATVVGDVRFRCPPPPRSSSWRPAPRCPTPRRPGCSPGPGARA